MALSNKKFDQFGRAGKTTPNKLKSPSKLVEHVYTTKLWVTVSSKRALLFDVSIIDQSLSLQWFLKPINCQTNNVYGTKFVKRNKLRYMEIYARKDTKNYFIKEGLTFTTAFNKYKIYPCEALEDDSYIIRLSLSQTPFEKSEEENIDGIKESLLPYGELLDIKSHLDSYSGIFMGSTLAIIETLNNASKHAPKLTHKIHYKETGDSFLAVWANMPTWCRYCHEEGHNKYDCEKSLASMICYNCKIQGHRAASCPRKYIKKAGKTPLLHSIDNDRFEDPNNSSKRTEHYETIKVDNTIIEPINNEDSLVIQEISMNKDQSIDLKGEKKE
ncbi:unnamed protein product [Cunninghamella blakesleeana]